MRIDEYMLLDRIRTNPTIGDVPRLIATIELMIGERAYLVNIAEAASKVLQFDKSVAALSEGSDNGALSQATQLLDGAFEDLETAVSEYEYCKNPPDEA